jgi:hypothetical protein
MKEKGTLINEAVDEEEEDKDVDLFTEESEY